MEDATKCSGSHVGDTSLAWQWRMQGLLTWHSTLVGLWVNLNKPPAELIHTNAGGT